jgi:hypothetical protein
MLVTNESHHELAVLTVSSDQLHGLPSDLKRFSAVLFDLYPKLNRISITLGGVTEMWYRQTLAYA